MSGLTPFASAANSIKASLLPLPLPLLPLQNLQYLSGAMPFPPCIPELLAAWSASAVCASPHSIRLSPRKAGTDRCVSPAGAALAGGAVFHHGLSVTGRARDTFHP